VTAPETPRTVPSAAEQSLAAALGGKRGLLDSGLPGALFVIVFTIAGLTAAIVSALGVGLALCVVRLVRRESVQHAISGLFGLGIAAFFAWRLRSPEGFFLPGIMVNVAYGSVLTISLVLRRPLLGYALRLLYPEIRDWRGDPVLRRAASLATAVWAGVFLARVAVQGPLYLAHHAGLLAGAKIAMGWPLTIAAGAATAAIIRKLNRTHPRGVAADEATAEEPAS
jgi:hypothetical protein